MHPNPDVLEPDTWIKVLLGLGLRRLAVTSTRVFTALCSKPPPSFLQSLLPALSVAPLLLLKLWTRILAAP